ncbi:MAG: sensor histidine kinase, partial [Phycicoccus sp.]
RRGHRQREDLLRRSVHALREERHRVAGRVHDGPVQDLSAALLTIDGLAARAAGAGDPSLGEDLRAVADRVRRAGDDQRTLLDDLYPPEFTRTAFMRIINDAAGPVRAAAISVDVKVSANAVAAIAPGEQELIRRLIGEALRNIARHADATTVRVRLDIEGPDVVLEIVDDGTGFDPEQLETPESGHLGTRVLRDLARKAGAELLLRTAPGAGTSWRLTLAARPY